MVERTVCTFCRLGSRNKNKTKDISSVGSWELYANNDLLQEPAGDPFSERERICERMF